MVNLNASNDFQRAILNYLNTLDDENLIKKINSGKKTLQGCQNYIYAEMRKRAQGGCAVASDAEVFGLVVHFFEEDSIHNNDAPVTREKVAVSKADNKPKMAAVEKKPEKDDTKQMSIFDFM